MTPKSRAHYLFNEAIRKGEIERVEICEQCRSSRHVVGHHDDYSKPLDVRWLCHSCHAKHHHANGQRPRGKAQTPNRRIVGEFDPLILEVAARENTPDVTLKKWRARGVPHRVRCSVYGEAERRGLPLPAFELERA